MLNVMSINFSKYQFKNKNGSETNKQENQFFKTSWKIQESRVMKNMIILKKLKQYLVSINQYQDLKSIKQHKILKKLQKYKLIPQIENYTIDKKYKSYCLNRQKINDDSMQHSSLCQYQILCRYIKQYDQKDFAIISHKQIKSYQEDLINNIRRISKIVKFAKKYIRILIEQLLQAPIQNRITIIMIKIKNERPNQLNKLRGNFKQQQQISGAKSITQQKIQNPKKEQQIFQIKCYKSSKKYQPISRLNSIQENYLIIRNKMNLFGHIEGKKEIGRQLMRKSNQRSKLICFNKKQSYIMKQSQQTAQSILRMNFQILKFTKDRVQYLRKNTKQNQIDNNQKMLEQSQI